MQAGTCSNDHPHPPNARPPSLADSNCLHCVFGNVDRGAAVGLDFQEGEWVMGERYVKERRKVLKSLIDQCHDKVLDQTTAREAAAWVWLTDRLIWAAYGDGDLGDTLKAAFESTTPTVKGE